MFCKLCVRFLLIGGLLGAPLSFAQDGAAVEKESDGKQQRKGKVEALTVKQGARGESKGKGEQKRAPTTVNEEGLEGRQPDKGKGDGKKTRKGGQQAGPQERPGKGKSQPAK